MRRSTAVGSFESTSPANDRTGKYAADFDAFAPCLPGGDLAGIPGVLVSARRWRRGPDDASGTSLTNAIEFMHFS